MTNGAFARRSNVSKALQAKLNTKFADVAAFLQAEIIEKDPAGHGMAPCDKCYFKCALTAPACAAVCEARCAHTDYCESFFILNPAVCVCRCVLYKSRYASVE